MGIETELLVRAVTYGSILFVGYIFYRLALKIADSSETKNYLIKRLATWYAIGESLIPEYMIVEKDEGGSKDPESKPLSSILNNKYFQIVTCWVGLCVSYSIWGLLQERLMTKTYDIHNGTNITTIKFRDSDFVIFVNRVFSFSVGMIILQLRRCTNKQHLSNSKLLHQLNKPPFYIFGFSSLSNLVSSFCQYESLKYISFPTQVVVKACKLIPVMVMNTIVSKQTYTRRQYFLALILCVGLGTFLYGNSINTPHKGLSIVVVNQNFSVWAVLLPLGYLIFDSFTATWQSKIFKDYDATDSVLAMTYSCIISSVLSFTSILANKQLSRVLILLQKSAKFRYHILGSGIASILGQLMVYHTIAVLGPIIFTLIMITRQILSVILSSFVYHHHLTVVSCVGIVIIFVTLICDRLYTLRNK